MTRQVAHRRRAVAGVLVAAVLATPGLAACSTPASPEIARVQPATPGTTKPAKGPTATPTAKPTGTASHADLPTGAVDWTQARSRLGRKATVCGPVVSAKHATSSSGRPTFLNIGAPYPDDDRVTVLIWGENLGHFPEAPVPAYNHRRICVTGTVKAFGGAVEIEATRPAQIRVLP